MAANYKYTLNLKRLIISILSASVIIMIIIFAVVYYKDKLDLINFIGIFGSIASIAGILISYFQILSVKEISESTKKAIDNSLNEMIKTFSVSDLSRTIKLTQEIQGFIRASKYESALLRMSDLKSVMIQIRHVKTLNEMYLSEDYKIISTDINIDISNINNVLLNKKNGVDYQKICVNLENVVTFLTNLENKLKYHRNE